eukprot:TRINITY_DN6167_c0_g1_i2.p1 TRINITY_DN6167_c0_g1~~TRINITY_DN6167_c0_g1_i2.p1  ORF type:complete len:190 (+),score=38.31 TRINITY_DN6167_c0_g1_i2:42-572(+)
MSLRRTAHKLLAITGGWHPLPRPSAGRWRVFVDLDGVLADFEKGLKTQGVTDLKANPTAGWNKLKEADGFFENLEWMEGARPMWDHLVPHQPIILTGLPRGNWAAPQKRKWVSTQIGTHVTVITCMKHEKPRMSTVGNLLIDDAEDTCLWWRKKGGTAIHHTSPEATIDALKDILV